MIDGGSRIPQDAAVAPWIFRMPKAQLEQLAVHSKVPDEAVLVRAAQGSPREAEPSCKLLAVRGGSQGSGVPAILGQFYCSTRLDLRRSQEAI